MRAHPVTCLACIWVIHGNHHDAFLPVYAPCPIQLRSVYCLLCSSISSGQESDGATSDTAFLHRILIMCTSGGRTTARSWRCLAFPVALVFICPVRSLGATSERISLVIFWWNIGFQLHVTHAPLRSRHLIFLRAFSESPTVRAPIVPTPTLEASSRYPTFHTVFRALDSHADPDSGRSVEFKL